MFKSVYVCLSVSVCASVCVSLYLCVLLMHGMIPLLLNTLCGLSHLINSPIYPIMTLYKHPSFLSFPKAMHLIETYFGGEAEESENLAPAVVTDVNTGDATPLHINPDNFLLSW